jgi:hypothetical protein
MVSHPTWYKYVRTDDVFSKIMIKVFRIRLISLSSHRSREGGGDFEAAITTIFAKPISITMYSSLVLNMCEYFSVGIWGGLELDEIDHVIMDNSHDL